MLKPLALSVAIVGCFALAGTSPAQAMGGTSSEKSDLGAATKAVNAQNWSMRVVARPRRDLGEAERLQLGYRASNHRGRQEQQERRRA